jgi:hypothetical protein
MRTNGADAKYIFPVVSQGQIIIFFQNQEVFFRVFLKLELLGQGGNQGKRPGRNACFPATESCPLVLRKTSLYKHFRFRRRHIAGLSGKNQSGAG